MRDGMVSVAEAGARPSVSLLRALKREFEYYCIEVVAEQPAKPLQPETVYVMGGEGGDRYAFSRMERYDAVSGQWSAAVAMSTARSQFGTCVIDDKIYVFGGRGIDYMPLASVEKYSPLSVTWITLAPMPVVRCCHVALAVGSAVYVLGGLRYGGGSGVNIIKLESTQGTWTEVKPAPQYIANSAAVAVGTDIYVFGGVDEAGGDQDCVMKYDTVADAWSPLAPMPHASSFHSACICNGLVYIAGAGSHGQIFLCFNPDSEVWTTLSPTLSNRRHCATFMLDGSLYAAGGVGNRRSSVERYDAATDTWTAVASMLEARSTFGAVTIGSAGPAEEQDLFDSLIDKAFRRQL
jgi:kelch-like protein 28